VHASPDEQRLLEDACAEVRRAARLVVLFGPATERLAPLLDAVPLLRADDVEGAIATAADHLDGAGALLVSPMFPLSMGERALVAPALGSLASS
jgi:UDP-N-acetylmuramoylalanine-D-glutamate ligase